MIRMILNDKGFNDRWNAYASKNTYVKDTCFENVIESIELLIRKIIQIFINLAFINTEKYKEDKNITFCF